MNRFEKNIFVVVVFFTMAIALSTGLANATIIHVPADYPTIQAGINAASSGDTVLVAVGTYQENIIMKSSIKLIGADSSKTVILGRVDAISVNEVLLSGFTISGTPQCIYSSNSTFTISGNIINGIEEAGIKTLNSTLLVERNTISGGAHGILFWLTDNKSSVINNRIDDHSCMGIFCAGAAPTIENNIVQTCNWGGIWCEGYSANAIIKNNIVMHNGTRGIGCKDASPSIISNIIIKNEPSSDWGDGDGIDCELSSYPIIKNNTIYGNARWGIESSENASPKVSNTIVWGNYQGQIVGSAIVSYSDIQGGYNGTGNINSDPQFGDVISDNYRLNEGSPCIDAGDPSPVYNDRDGTRNDMGAYGGPDAMGFDSSSNTPLIIGTVIATPRYIIPGDLIRITAYVFDAESNVNSVNAEIESPNENVITTLTLYDDGNHADGDLGDHIYSNTWATTLEERNYYVDIIAVEDDTNSTTHENSAYFSAVLTKPDYNIYFGNLHSHTSYSDGVGTPAEAFGYARDVAQIDFLAVTDHNWVEVQGLLGLDTQEYSDIITQSNNFTQNGIFVAFAGQEWSGTDPNTGVMNHVNVFEADNLFITPTYDFNILFTELIRSGCTATYNHPSDNRCFNNLTYSFAGDMSINLVEVRTDVEQRNYVELLNKGWHVGVDGSQDNHSATWGDGPHWTAALAPALTKFDILDAMRNHRTYSTYDKNFSLIFKVNDYWMGESFSNVDNIAFTVNINDQDSDDNTECIELYQDGMIVNRIFSDGNSYTWNPVITPPDGEHNYFVKVYQKDGDKIWSSPIWINSTTNLPSTPIVSYPPNHSILTTLTPIFMWHPSSNANSYTLQYSTSVGFPNEQSTVTITDITDTSYALSDNLEDNTFYYWRVSSSNNHGNSAYSAVSRFLIDSDVLFSSDSEIRLTADLSEDMRPSIIETSEGKMWLVWCSLRNDNYELYYKISSDSGEHWSEDFRLTAEVNYDLSPAITEDSEGTIWVTWHTTRDGNYEIYCKTFDGASWSGEINLTQNGSSDYGSSIIQTSDGLIWMVWNSDRADGNQEIYYKTFDGITWSSETRLTYNDAVDAYPEIIQIDTGELWLMWHSYRDGNSEIYYKIFDGTSWSDDIRLTNTSDGELYSSITQSSNGQIWVTYEKWYENIAYRIFDNDTWSDESMLPHDSYTNHWSSITQTSDGRIWIAYYSTRNGNTDIYAQRSNYPHLTSVEITDAPITPIRFKLDQNYPNPFNPTTTIHYVLPEESTVTITIYDMIGRNVNKLISQKQLAGNHSIQWNGKDINCNPVGTGIYFYQIQAGDFIQAKKMVLMK